ncbi:hypothetical protein J1N35_000039 [Gossypium stocksii]|uniref:Uncharacterized protein n=1 Tax=Gossypium stocksii TaxID=47602 RepID=A0A9D3WHM6_9ROSI|nr:hypothetical protein J1N35_000039 [Gossypium stocksii]
MVVALKKETEAIISKFEELEGELIVCRVVVEKWMLASILKQRKVDVLKSKKFKGMRSARDAKQELRRQGIIELTIAIAKVKSFVELCLMEDKFESSKPKETDNGAGNHEEEGQVENGNYGNCKNGGNEKPHNGKWKFNNKPKGPVKCFLCDNLRIIRNCPKNMRFLPSKGTISQTKYR